jgi:soluble calcium-activated nucleotidase 1
VGLLALLMGSACGTSAKPTAGGDSAPATAPTKAEETKAEQYKPEESKPAESAATPAAAEKPPEPVESKPAKSAETPAADPVAVEKLAESADKSAGFENGHDVLREAGLLADRTKCQALNAKKVAPGPVGTVFPVGFIADQDEASKTDSGWESMFAYGKLTYSDDNKYSLELTGESNVVTKDGDKSSRGAEYSALEIFDGKLLTMCDRTGDVDEIKAVEGGYSVFPLQGEERVVMKLGDGKKDKPLKCEWTTMKGGKMLVGSTGKERTDDDGNVVHEGEMWVKAVEPGTYKVEHIDGRPIYRSLRAAAKCPHGAGYMIHESARWSDVHQMYFFMPRKLSRAPYDEVADAAKCVNLMLAAPENPSEDGSDVIMQPYLDFSELRGCSDFFFIPGTGDCHIFVLRTEETLDNVISTYASVIDVEGNILMPEFQLALNRKFEGACLLSGFADFGGELPSAGAGECTIS